MSCCPNCFGDKGLRREVIPQNSTKAGTCQYCESENQPLVAPNLLADYFEVLVSIYRPDNDGKTLVEWLKEDWLMFDHENIDDARAQVLLAEILDDGEIVRQRFVPSDLCVSDGLDRWEILRKELMHENRFFPNTKIDFERLEERLSRLILDVEELPENWFRARIQQEETAFTIDGMGAPPERVASHGRANPAGIPYLYVGSTSDTAISEVRPHPGEKACVAEFELKRELKIADLREPRKTISPFLSTDENEIAANSICKCNSTVRA